MTTTPRSDLNRILLLLLFLAMVSCTSQEIETESLYNQMALNEERNAEVIKKLTNTIETRGNRTAELEFLRMVKSLGSLKKELKLNSKQIKNSPTYNSQKAKTYIDTLTVRFGSIDENEEYIKLLAQTRVRLAGLDPAKEDEYLHMILQISYCEVNLFAFYEEEVGVRELYWDDEEDFYENEIFDLDSLATGLNFKAKSNYTITKQDAIKLRERLTQEYEFVTSSAKKEAILDSAQHLFVSYLLSQIVPYWYGTEWEFDGYTAIPNQGAIACGYFVSTTLEHMGVNVNRYKLAQQNPENEAKTISIDQLNLKKYKFDEPKNDIYLNLTTYPNGLYFVGLDSHVGYLYIKNEQAYFIHSDYIDGYVRIENAKSSYAFESFEYFISPISTNKSLMIKWLLQEEIEVMRN